MRNAFKDKHKPLLLAECLKLLPSFIFTSILFSLLKLNKRGTELYASQSPILFTISEVQRTLFYLGRYRGTSIT